MKGDTYTLADIKDWVDTDVYPVEHERMYAKFKHKRFKKRIDHSPLYTLNECLNHWYLKQYLPEFIEAFKGTKDLYITGSWVRGTWRHPDSEITHDKIKIAALDMKKPISDIDFWTSKTSKEMAKPVLERIADKLDIKVSWVEWPGPAIYLYGDGENGWVGCNDRGHILHNFENKF